MLKKFISLELIFKNIEKGDVFIEKSKSYKLALSGLLIALAVILGSFSIPILGARVSPMQHFVNVVSAVLLGPFYALGNAFIASFIRNILGTGSLLAFPGSMIGAFLSGLLYEKYKSKIVACFGEFIGTGIIGALIAYPVAAFLMGKEAGLLIYIIPFSSSSLVGALIAYLLLRAKSIENIFKKVET